MSVPYLVWMATHWDRVIAMLAEGDRGIAEAPRSAEAGLVLWIAAGYGLLPAGSGVAPWLDPLGQAGQVALVLVGVLLATGWSSGAGGRPASPSWEPRLLAVAWLILAGRCLVGQSSSIYLHYLVALFPALFIVAALPLGWLLAHGGRQWRRSGRSCLAVWWPIS